MEYGNDPLAAPKVCEKCGARLEDVYHDVRVRYDRENGDKVTLARMKRLCPNRTFLGGHTAWFYGYDLYAGVAHAELELSRVSASGQSVRPRTRREWSS